MSSKLRNFISFIVFVLVFSAIVASAGVHFSFIGEHLPQRINVSKTDSRNYDGTSPKYTFYDELPNRKSKLKVNRDLTAPTEGDETADKQYVVQIGVFYKDRDAQRVKTKAENFGYPVTITQRGKQFLVQAGPFFGKSTTNTAKRKLAKKGFDTLIKLVK